jgi:hypothetical protein
MVKLVQLTSYEISLLAAADWRASLDLGSRYSRGTNIWNKIRHILVGSDSDNYRALDSVTRNT